MGLDIYVYKTRTEGNDIAVVNETDNKLFKNRFRVRFNRFINAIDELDKADNKNALEGKYNSLIEFIKDNIQYDFVYKDIIDNRLNKEQLKTWYDNNKHSVYLNEDYYYRKVNFLFRFFSQRTTMQDEALCWVSKEDTKALVEACNIVISNRLNGKDKAKSILPTCSGFFFGSVEYDDYYYDDVIQVRNDFQELLDNWKDNERVYIIFSY